MDERDLATLPGGSQSFEETFGERLRSILDVDSWVSGYDLPQIYEEVATQVEAAVRHESKVRASLRQTVFPLLESAQGAPRGAGTYRVTLDELKRVHQGLLFNGAVEGCDSTQYTLETLPVSITQIGVGLVSYSGNQGTWTHRLYRRDLRESWSDPAEEAIALLERRSRRDAAAGPGNRDELSRLARRAIASYAERAILLYRSNALWRVGRGQPAPYELLTWSAGTLDIMIESTKILERLICDHQKFVFVPREVPDWLYRTLGAALDPLEFAIVGTLSETVDRLTREEQYYLPTSSDTTVDGRRLTPREWVQRFRDEIASRVVVGIYRTSELAPAHLFYAHVDHAHEAAMVALADSLLQPHRGFPTLLDVARHLCEATFGQDSLAAALQLGYSRAGVPLEYMSGRMPH